MALPELTDAQQAALATHEAARVTRDRAALSRHLADTRLHFLDRARPLLDGDPWLLAQPPIVQTAYRAHHAESSALEYERLAEALFWLDQTRTLLDESAAVLNGSADD
ncbi:MAG: hypothetical protein AAFX58_12590, partial [Pseudomonadota bacterium]